MSEIEKVRRLMKKYPDSPHKRKILSILNGVEEQQNGFLFGLAGCLGYEFDTVEKKIRRKT